MNKLTPAQVAIVFSDPKLNAMREAAVTNNWPALFKIAPRGCVGRDGVTDAHGNKGVCGDMPGVRPGDPRGEAAYKYWRGNNPLRKNLTLQDLRFRKNAQGQAEFVPVTEAQLTDLWTRYNWARHDWKCRESQVFGMIDDWMQSGQVYLTHQCAEKSSDRRKKILKKAAIGAAAITGAVFLGPSALAAAKAAGGAVVGGANAVTGVVMKGASAVTGALNARNTIEAIKDGKVPPPPIDVNGSSFTEWATAIAQQELGRAATASEKEMLRAEVLRMQQQMGSILNRQQTTTGQPVQYYPMKTVPVEVQQAMAAKKADSISMQTLLLAGAPILIALLATR